MPKSLRLGDELERKLDAYCLQTGETLSHVVRESVAEYIVRKQRRKKALTAYELGEDLFGADNSPLPYPNVSGRVKQLIKEKLRAKHHR